jgi:hypothetical protein
MVRDERGGRSLWRILIGPYAGRPPGFYLDTLTTWTPGPSGNIVDLPFFLESIRTATWIPPGQGPGRIQVARSLDFAWTIPLVCSIDYIHPNRSVRSSCETPIYIPY